VGHYRRAIQVTGVVHCALEYYRWAARSQLRAEGRRFAAAVARIPTVPVLQVNGALDPCVQAPTAAASHRWAGSEHRMHVMPATGHFPHEEHPAATTGLLSEALRAS
jgi:pimeloyl-ACP methyl ester carboxylesterase